MNSNHHHKKRDVQVERDLSPSVGAATRGARWLAIDLQWRKKGE